MGLSTELEVDDFLKNELSQSSDVNGSIIVDIT